MNRVMAAAANPNSFQQQSNSEENPELLDPRYIEHLYYFLSSYISSRLSLSVYRRI